MAFCKDCGKEIEENAKFCDACGKQQWEDVAADSVPAGAACADTTVETLSEQSATGDTVVRNVAPVAEAQIPAGPEGMAAVSAKNSSTKKVVLFVSIGIVVLAAVLIVALVFGLSASKEKKALEEYANNFNNVILTMTTGASDAEDLSRLAARVWYNAIYEKSESDTDPYVVPGDFEESITKMYRDVDIVKKTINLKDNMSSVEDALKTLAGPPEEFEKAYSGLQELYSAYQAVMNMALDPSGSYNSYSQEVRTKTDKYIECINKLKLQIPDLKKK